MFSTMRHGVLLLVVAAALPVSISGQAIQFVDTNFGGSNMITGTVLSPNGLRVQRVSVRLRTMTKGDRIAVTDESGNFGFRGLRNGDYQLVIEKETNYETLSQSVSIIQMPGAPGGNYMVSLRLKVKPSIEPKPGVVNAGTAGLPKDTIEHYDKAIAMSKAGDHKGAITELEKILTEHPTFLLAWNEMGVQYLKLGDVAKAEASFTEALKIEPRSHMALVNRGIALFTMRRYKDAATPLRLAVEVKDQDAVGHYFLGQTVANLGDFVEAEKELLIALNLGGEQMKEAHRLLAIIYSSKGEKKRAAAQLEKYLELNPNAPDADQLRRSIEQLKAADGGSAAATPKPPGL